MLVAACCALLATCAHAQGMFGGGESPHARALPAAVRDIGIEQKLNEQIPLDLVFRDETGKSVKLGDYFGPQAGSKPVLLNLVYFSCPMLCNELLAGVAGSLKALKLTAGNEFTILSVSIDPQDGPSQAAAKKADSLRRYGRPQAASGWHFLTGDERNIQALARAVGFRYRYDAEHKQFLHAAGIMLLTPEGVLSRYFYGVEFGPRDLRLGLVEAGENKIGTLADAFLLLCYHYDPTTGKYTLLVLNTVRAGGVLTLLLLGTFIGTMLREESKARAKMATQAAAVAHHPGGLS